MAFDTNRQGMAERIKHKDTKQGYTYSRLLDPLFWVAYMLSSFLLNKKYKLNKVETIFILDNIDKHRKVLWVNLIGGYLVFTSLANYDNAQLAALISVLMAPAFITGGAWFAITFGGVPQKLLDAALIITFWMLSAFSLSITTMSIAAYYILNGQILIFIVLLFINFSVILSAILYDDIDGLKVGLDEALKNNSLANLRYLKREYDIEPPKEGQDLYHDIKEFPKENK